MKWVFVIAGIALVMVGACGKYVDMTKYKEPFISGNSPFYTLFMTGIITIILGLSFDWIMSLDDEEEQAPGEDAPPEPEPEPTEGDAAESKEDDGATKGADEEPEPGESPADANQQPQAESEPPDESDSSEDA